MFVLSSHWTVQRKWKRQDWKCVNAWYELNMTLIRKVLHRSTPKAWWTIREQFGQVLDVDVYGDLWHSFPWKYVRISKHPSITCHLGASFTEIFVEIQWQRPRTHDGHYWVRSLGATAGVASLGHGHSRFLGMCCVWARPRVSRSPPECPCYGGPLGRVIHSASSKAPGWKKKKHARVEDLLGSTRVPTRLTTYVYVRTRVSWSRLCIDASIDIIIHNILYNIRWHYIIL